jgi:hypothetical protein
LPASALVRLRTVALVLVALFAGLAQLGRAAELLLVAHAPCEHGDLVHAEAPVAIERPAQGSHETRVHQGSSAAEHSDHEHCDANGALQAPAHADVVVPEATLLTWLEAAAWAPGPERRQLAPLAVAPKASPPRA